MLTFALDVFLKCTFYDCPSFANHIFPFVFFLLVQLCERILFTKLHLLIWTLQFERSPGKILSKGSYQIIVISSIDFFGERASPPPLYGIPPYIGVGGIFFKFSWRWEKEHEDDVTFAKLDSFGSDFAKTPTWLLNPFKLIQVALCTLVTNGAKSVKLHHHMSFGLNHSILCRTINS